MQHMQKQGHPSDCGVTLRQGCVLDGTTSSIRVVYGCQAPITFGDMSMAKWEDCPPIIRLAACLWNRAVAPVSKGN